MWDTLRIRRGVSRAVGLYEILKWCFATAYHRFTMTENGTSRSQHIKVCWKALRERERERKERKQLCQKVLREREREREGEKAALHPQAIWPRPRNTSAVPKKGRKVPTSWWKYFLLSRETFVKPVAVGLVITLIPLPKAVISAGPQFPFRPDRDSLGVSFYL